MPAETAQDRATMKLVIEDDEGKRTIVPLTRDEITIGRKDGNTIRLTERNVSRFHARLMRQETNVFIEDLNSYTGVRINGDRISGRVQVSEGDLIEIGDYHLALQAEGGQEALAAQAGAESTVRDQIPMSDETVKVPIPMADAPAPVPAPASADVTPPPPANAVPSAVEIAPPEPPPMPAAPPQTGAAEVKRAEPTAIIRQDQVEGATLPGVPEIPENERAKLVVVATNLAGQEFVLTRREMVIGRTDDNEVTLDHRSVSRHHAKILFDAGAYAVVDLKSANGVLVNGEEYTQTVLRPGDILELGHVQLRFIEPGGRFELSAEEIAAIKAEAAELENSESADGAITSTARFARGPVDAALRGKKKFFLTVAGLAALFIAVGLFIVFRGDGDVAGETELPGDVAVNPLPDEIPIEPNEVEPVEPVEPTVELSEEEVAQLLQQARTHIKVGEFEQAGNAAGQVLTADADNAEAQALVEQVVRERRAEEDFEAAIADIEAKRLEQALERLGGVPEDTQFRERAVKLAAKIKSDLAKEYEASGREALAEGDLEAARQEYEKGVALVARSRSLKDLNRKIKAAEKAAAKGSAAKQPKPKQPKVKKGGKTGGDRKEPKSRFNTEDARSFYNAGNRFILQGKFKEAVEQFKLALKADPTFADAHRGLGIAYARLGKPDMAVRHYELYLNARPYAQDAAKVQEILKNYRKAR